jgi:hypothetical protein
MFDYKSATE